MTRLTHCVPFAAALALVACDQFEDPDIAQIRSIDPDSGAVGSVVAIEAENLLDNTRVVFADEVESPIALLFIDMVVTIVPRGAETGDVRLETGGERSSSRALFRVVPPPPARSALFDPQVGNLIPTFTGGCGSDPLDDGFAAVPLPFSFPFYGRPQAQMFVTTNGSITFGEARPCDNVETVSRFATADKIALAQFDLEIAGRGAVRANTSLPDRVVVTWDELPLCDLEETSSTFQAVLFADGRIQMNFGYFSTRGVATGCTANVVTGSITGITPLTPATLRRVTFTAETPLTIGTQEGVYNPFFVGSYFNLENRSLLFSPLTEAGVFSGYRVELL